ncbi:LAME_0G03048g1_1 [Lachancea meyersii CBS 8951]|uniref:LAME_0G03048g1_1 n=1 Tax=Lachancea meyersii CBS 8951 TaxID=1266667 RepID=A0A1G4K6D6_9SACH|nr:LAME_0G03048g1_1 [Lachancea meyersii CBS 8951]
MLNTYKNQSFSGCQMTKGVSECQVPRRGKKSLIVNARERHLTYFDFPCTRYVNVLPKTCHFVSQKSKYKDSKQLTFRSKNKFILMRSLLHSTVLKIASCSHTDQKGQFNVEEVSKIASWLWRQNRGVFQSYFEVLAVFEERRVTKKPVSFPSVRKLSEAIGKQCIPSTYSYETLTNGADTTAMESKKTYKAFCGRFSLKEATGRVRKKKPIQTFALRSANIEDVFLL